MKSWCRLPFLDSAFKYFIFIMSSFYYRKAGKDKLFRAVKIQSRAILLEPSNRDPTFSHTKHSPSACPEKIPRDLGHQRHTVDTYSAFCHLPKHLNAHHNIFDPFRKLYFPFRYVGTLTAQQLTLKVVQEEQRSKLTRKRKT